MAEYQATPSTRSGRPRDPEKTIAILDAAWRVIAAERKRLSIEQVAREAGVSKVTIYARFAAAEDLSDAAAVYYRKLLLEKLHAAAKCVSVSESMINVGLMFVHELQSNRLCFWTLSQFGIIGDVVSILERVLEADAVYGSRQHKDRTEVCYLLIGHWLMIALSWADQPATKSIVKERVAAAWLHASNLMIPR